MIDPADSITRTLPQPTRICFASESRTYTVVLDQDLLQDWTVTQSWGGKNNQRGGGKITPVDSFEAGLQLLQTIAKRRAKHGYHLLT